VPCNTGVCPTLGEWSEYTDCSKTCGTGNQKRMRECRFGSRNDCAGPMEQNRTCNTHFCPVWSTWTRFGECSATCGPGTTSRSRECEFGEDGIDCLGDNSEVKPCHTKNCPIWSDWSEFTECSESCGDGLYPFFISIIFVLKKPPFDFLQDVTKHTCEILHICYLETIMKY
jgi:hypothetical protein